MIDQRRKAITSRLARRARRTSGSSILSGTAGSTDAEARRSDRSRRAPMRPSLPPDQLALPEQHRLERRRTATSGCGRCPLAVSARLAELADAGVERDVGDGRRQRGLRRRRQSPPWRSRRRDSQMATASRIHSQTSMMNSASLWNQRSLKRREQLDRVGGLQVEQRMGDRADVAQRDAASRSASAARS